MAQLPVHREVNPATPKVSITLLVWNALPGLHDCLRSIEPEVESGFAEVIAVDNASPDESAEVVEQFLPQAKMIRTEENLGFGGGVNQSWPHVHAPYWLLLNPDATFEPGGLSELVAWMEARPEIGAASPGIGQLDGSGASGTPRALPSATKALAEMLRLHKLLPADVRARIFQGPYWPGGDNLHADWVPGTAIIVRREAVEQAGLPDPSFFLYGEDIEWCWRIRRAGWAIGYCSGVVVRHEGSASNLRSYGRPDTLLRMARTEIEAVSRARGSVRGRFYGAAMIAAVAAESVHPGRSKDVRRQNRAALRAWGTAFLHPRAART
jgi:GT2 family glycosyltransferase